MAPYLKTATLKSRGSGCLILKKTDFVQHKSLECYFHVNSFIDRYLQGIDDQVPRLQLSLQDAEKHQQLWLGHTLHIQLGL